MPRDEWARANARAKYGRVQYTQKGPKRTPRQRKVAKKVHWPFALPAGTLVSICREDDENRRWVPHTTRIPLKFWNEHKTRDCRGTSGAVIFRHMGYLILTRREIANSP